MNNQIGYFLFGFGAFLFIITSVLSVILSSGFGNTPLLKVLFGLAGFIANTSVFFFFLRKGINK